MVQLLPSGLLLIFLGLLIHVLAAPAPIGTMIAVALCVAFGICLVCVALWRRFHHGRPLFRLSPDGIDYRIPWLKALHIPWSEIRGIDTIDVAARYWSFWDFRHGFQVIPDRKVVNYPNVTVVLVSKPFYDRWISVPPRLLPGPGWRANFIPKDGLVQVALHHDLVSAEPRPLREAIEARWIAFRDRPGKTSVAVGQDNATTASKPAVARVRDGRRCHGGKPESRVAVAGGGGLRASDWHRRPDGQSRRVVGVAEAEPGARSQNQGADRTESLGGLDQAEQGRKQKARGGAERVAAAARRGHAADVCAIEVQPAPASDVSSLVVSFAAPPADARSMTCRPA
jgi:hypothetical protein